LGEQQNPLINLFFQMADNNSNENNDGSGGGYRLNRQELSELLTELIPGLLAAQQQQQQQQQRQQQRQQQQVQTLQQQQSTYPDPATALTGVANPNVSFDSISDFFWYFILTNYFCFLSFQSVPHKTLSRAIREIGGKRWG